MATFIISGSRGTDDSTMATLPFMAAKVAKEQGHEVVLWLWNEAVTLGRKGTADHVTGVNLTPMKDLLSSRASREYSHLGLRGLRRGTADRRRGSRRGRDDQGHAGLHQGGGRMRKEHRILTKGRTFHARYS